MKRDVLVLNGHISNEDNVSNLFFDFIQKEDLYFIGEAAVDKTFNIFLINGYVFSDSINPKEILNKFQEKLDANLCNFVGLKKIECKEI